MRLSGCTAGRFVALITVLLSLAFSPTATAQTVTDPNVSTTTPVEGGTPRISAGTSSVPPPQRLKALKSATRDRAKLAAYNNAAWDVLRHQGSCTKPRSNECANDAMTLAGSTCSSSALIFQKGTAVWQKWQFVLVIASAGFTGVGSAATIAGSTTVPKVFSTLGGTTGLGAVTATTNSDIADNQAGVSAVNAIQLELQKVPYPVKDDDPVNQSILSQANGYANLCVAANPVGTPGGTPATKGIKPAGNPGSDDSNGKGNGATGTTPPK